MQHIRPCRPARAVKCSRVRFDNRTGRGGKLARWCRLICLPTVSILLGCGGHDTVRVHGTVTYNGEPLQQGRVGFYPEDGRPSFGEIRDGRFELTTFNPGDGALPGKHRVTIQSDKPADPNDAFSDRIPLIPQRYFKVGSSELTAEVEPLGDNKFEFALAD